MKNQSIFIVATAVFGLAACDRTEPESQTEKPVPARTFESVSTGRPARLEMIPVTFESDSSSKDEGSEGNQIAYEAGDIFEGMWNYDRRSARLRLSIQSVDMETRTILATMQSEDLDNAEKQFEGKVGEDGRQLVLTGVPGTGGRYKLVSEYDVSDFLRESSKMKVNLDDCNARKLRGSVENGTNIYFWSEVKPTNQ